MIKAFIQAPQKFYQELERADKARIKNAQVAVKVEGFRLRKLLQAEIRAGAPGGRVFAPLTELARRSRRPSDRDKPALFRLALAVRYTVSQGPNDMKMEIGFTGPRVSGTWKGIATRQQEGFTFSAEERRRTGSTHRSYLARLGHAEGTEQSFALKAATTTLHVPPRPIIEPFWMKYQARAWRNIEQNFERKMRGERI